MIEVGEYVRIDKDHRIIALGIAKVVKTINETIYVKNNFELPITIDKNSISKHSKNIIDLIEVGDYVNGEYVIQVDKESNCIYIENTYYDEERGEELHKYIKQNWIKSIVTKEQLKNIEYRLED